MSPIFLEALQSLRLAYKEMHDDPSGSKLDDSENQARFALFELCLEITDEFSHDEENARKCDRAEELASQQ